MISFFSLYRLSINFNYYIYTFHTTCVHRLPLRLERIWYSVSTNFFIYYLSFQLWRKERGGEWGEEKRTWVKPSETRNSVRAKNKLLTLKLSCRRLYKLQIKISGHAVAYKFSMGVTKHSFLLPNNFYLLFIMSINWVNVCYFVLSLIIFTVWWPPVRAPPNNPSSSSYRMFRKYCPSCVAFFLCFPAHEGTVVLYW